MWLYLVAIVLIIIGVVGGAITGGLFAFVLLPVGVLALVAAVVVGNRARVTMHRNDTLDPHAPLPHGAAPARGVSSTPDGLTEARRAAQ